MSARRTLSKLGTKPSSTRRLAVCPNGLLNYPSNVEGGKAIGLCEFDEEAFRGLVITGAGAAGPVTADAGHQRFAVPQIADPP